MRNADVAGDRCKSSIAAPERQPVDHAACFDDESVEVRFDDPLRPSIRSDFAAGNGRFFFTIDERRSDIWVAEIGHR